MSDENAACSVVRGTNKKPLNTIDTGCTEYPSCQAPPMTACVWQRQAAAIRFLVQATNGSDPRPFFLGMGHHRPHLPYVGVACCPPPLLRPSSGTVQCESIPSRVLVTCTHTHTLTHSHTHASDRSPTAVLSRYTPTHTLIHTRTALYGCMRITHIKQQYERFAQMHHAQSQSGRLCS
eukprot:m.400487 g.400487  ORF g.400487 m.400487 type:complete len:178 (-) comp21159_c0_seq26:683-1216(-)